MSTVSTTTTTTTTQTLASKPRVPIHVQRSTSYAAVPASTPTFVSAFEADPVTAYMLSHLSPSARLPAMQSLFTLSSNATLLAGGELWSASTTAPASSSATTSSTTTAADSVPDYQAAAAIYPPNTSPDSLGASSLPSLLLRGGLFPALRDMGPIAFMQRMHDFTAATAPAKKAIFPDGEPFFYIQVIGAGAQYRGKGLAPALIRELQGRARREGRKVYLEASNEGARKVYLKLGFEDVGDVVRVGKGVCDAKGQVEGVEEGAKVGVPFWPMVWLPQESIGGQ